MTSSVFAFFAYLLSIVGSLLVFIFRRDDRFAIYHANQSLALFLYVIGLFVGWLVIGWIISWIPLLGPVLAAASFALVIAGWIFAIYAWIKGIMAALRGEIKPLPLIGRWAERLTVMNLFGSLPVSGRPSWRKTL